MLTVIIEHKNEVVYLKPFEDHREAIDHFCELYGNLHNDACLTITNLEEIPLSEKIMVPYYVS